MADKILNSHGIFLRGVAASPTRVVEKSGSKYRFLKVEVDSSLEKFLYNISDFNDSMPILKKDDLVYFEISVSAGNKGLNIIFQKAL